jgi:hypothetical protein
MRKYGKQCESVDAEKITKKLPALPSKPEWPKDWGLIGLLTSRFIE